VELATAVPVTVSDVVLNELIIQGFLEHDPVLMRKGGMTEAEIKERCGDTYE